MATSGTTPKIRKKRESPLAAHVRLQVEETDFAVAAVPARHVTEAVAVSGLRVALAGEAGGARRIARARWRKKQLLNTGSNNVQRFDIGGIIGIDFVAEERSLVRGWERIRISCLVTRLRCLIFLGV